MTYLYLLPFKDGVHFKLGISKALDSRIRTHYSTYDLDLDRSLIVSAKKNIFVLSLEQELLILLEDPKYPHFFDGSTEIRLMQDFEKTLSYIDSKIDIFGFKVEKYDGSKFKEKPDKNHIKHMRILIDTRKRLKLTEIELAKGLNITEDEYIRIEKMGCEDSVKKNIIFLFFDGCNNIKDGARKNKIRWELLKILEEINKEQ